MIVLVRRLGQCASAGGALALALSADERTGLRGHRRTAQGLDLLLQLPRGAALEPGELLASTDGSTLVVVEAAEEALLVVRGGDPRSLLQAAYHLGNRHVAMELRAEELRLLQDPVLEDLLRQRGLAVERVRAPFRPEPGAYSAGHGH